MRERSILCEDEEQEEQSAKKGIKIAVPLVMAAAVIASLVLVGMKDNAIYAKSVDELMAYREEFVGRTVRVEGTLVPGTLLRNEQSCEYKFKIAKKNAKMDVSYHECVIPDTFRDVSGIDVNVTVQGELQNDDTFKASSILTKCPSKYEMHERVQAGEEVPHR